MTAATPIHAIRMVGQTIFAVDYTGGLDIIANCPNDDQAHWLGNCLAQFHRVRLERAGTEQETPKMEWQPDPAWGYTPDRQARVNTIQEVADRLNDWLAETNGYQSDTESIIGKLRSFATE